MNKADTLPSERSGDEALALDYVLGILLEPDLSQALRRIEGEAGFALLVSRYRAQLMAGSIGVDRAGEAPVRPRAETWDAILARIGAADRP